MGDAELLEQLRVGGAFLQGIQLLAVQVFQERVTEQDVVVRLADDRRDRREARLACGCSATDTKRS